MQHNYWSNCGDGLSGLFTGGKSLVLRGLRCVEGSLPLNTHFGISNPADELISLSPATKITTFCIQEELFADYINFVNYDPSIYMYKGVNRKLPSVWITLLKETTASLVQLGSQKQRKVFWWYLEPLLIPFWLWTSARLLLKEDSPRKSNVYFINKH